MDIRLFYSTKLPSGEFDPEEVLFLPRILELVQDRSISLDLFLTEVPKSKLTAISIKLLDECPGKPPLSVQLKRIDEAALKTVVGKEDERAASVFYVCGPPGMTDGLVQQLREIEGVAPERVFCEKWW